MCRIQELPMSRWIVLCLLCLILTIPLHAQDNSTKYFYNIALRRIQEAVESGALELRLSMLGLNEVPPEIGQLTNLQVLYLSANQLANIPPEILQLTNLQYLFLGENNLVIIPSEIGQLTNLQVLDLSYNELTSLPSEIRNLRNLQVLNLGSNQLTSLPVEIGQLANLRQLYLYDNQLQHLPTQMSNLTNLTCADYCSLALDNNPLISPPPEVVEQGTDAVLAYLRNQAWYHVQRLIISVAVAIGLPTVLLLGLYYRRTRGKSKAKRVSRA
jgi:Leucine-rich repeat (LRR) protein